MTNALKRDQSLKTRVIYLLSCFIVLMLLDHYIELSLGATQREIFLDLLLELPRLLLAACVVYFVWKEFNNERVRKKLVEKRLATNQWHTQKLEKQVRHFSDEIHNYIQTQFDDWKFSKSEREVALLILKGKLTKEIAQCRFTSDRTIRNQCQSIYEKSGLSGRHELAGYFLERFIPNPTT